MLNLYVNNLFWNKALNYITVRKNELWRFLPFNFISKRGVGDNPSKDYLKKQLYEMLGPMDEALRGIDKEEKDVILKWANLTLEHRFDYLGSGLVQMNTIKWNCDFKTGKEWPIAYYLKQRKKTESGADIKVPWELSRCHHLLWLGEAYLLTNNEKYSKEVIDEINDWLENNPFLYSVNWVCAMDVAIRATNWIFSLSMILESPLIDNSFLKKIYTSLYQHGWFIFNNLERSVPHSNNHFFSDLSGLLYLSFLFQNTKYGNKWYKYVIPEYFEEVRRQILPSGVHYERSLSYHRLMTELVSYPSYLLKRRYNSLPPDIEYRIRSMYSFIATYSKANGRAPLIEDNDDGRFLPFVRRDFRRHDYLLNPDSLENKIIKNNMDMPPFDKEDNKIYYDAGHAVLRNNEAYLFVTNGGLSKYEMPPKVCGTHTHNDRLSFEFALGIDDVFIDPGAYVYTPEPEKSIEFRSTLKHNTIIVDNEEQNFLMPENVFLQKKNSRTTKFCYMPDNIIEGEYVTIDQHLKHKRGFKLLKDELIISDFLSKSGIGHKAILSYHLSPEVSVEENHQGYVLETSNYYIDFSFESKSLSIQKEIVDDTYSPSYGVLDNSKTVRIYLRFDDNVLIETKIKWKKKN